MAFPATADAPDRPVPRLPGWDHTRHFLADPYRFLGHACRDLGSDLVQLRLALQPVYGLHGPRAAALFYDTGLFRRAGAAPEPLRATLLGKGTVQALDGPAHRLRKQWFVQLTGPLGTSGLLGIALSEWERLVPRWEAAPRFVLYPAVQDWLMRSACRWAGLPLAADSQATRTGQTVALFDRAASGLRDHWHARRARRALEHWIGGLVQAQRAGRPALPPGSPAAQAATLRDAQGELLPPRVAAAELLNLVRPTVAVSLYVTFLAHALHVHPGWRERLAAGDEALALAFAQEVRRDYPFFPAVAAIACRDVAWEGLRIPAGARVLLDLYGTNHDPRTWVDPYAFRPERFLGAPPGAFEFVPQGGATAAGHHRCPGEDITLALMQLALRRLVAARYRVPPQDLTLAMERLPAQPRSGLVVEGWRAR